MQDSSEQTSFVLLMSCWPRQGGRSAACFILTADCRQHVLAWQPAPLTYVVAGSSSGGAYSPTSRMATLPAARVS